MQEIKKWPELTPKEMKRPFIATIAGTSKEVQLTVRFILL